MKRKLILSILFLGLFLLVLAGVIFNVFTPFDNYTSSVVFGLESKVFISISRAIEIIFDTITLVIATLIISGFLFFKKRKQGLMFTSLMLADGLLLYIIKELIGKARPLNGLTMITGFSFPSGHAAAGVVFFGLILYIIGGKRKKLVFPCIILMVLIALSRIYLNAHWFSDVLGGVFLGLFILFFGIYLFERK